MGLFTKAMSSHRAVWLGVKAQTYLEKHCGIETRKFLSSGESAVFSTRIYTTTQRISGKVASSDFIAIYLSEFWKYLVSIGDPSHERVGMHLQLFVAANDVSERVIGRILFRDRGDVDEETICSERKSEYRPETIGENESDERDANIQEALKLGAEVEVNLRLSSEIDVGKYMDKEVAGDFSRNVYSKLKSICGEADEVGFSAMYLNALANELAECGHPDSTRITLFLESYLNANRQKMPCELVDYIKVNHYCGIGGEHEGKVGVPRSKAGIRESKSSSESPSASCKQCGRTYYLYQMYKYGQGFRCEACRNSDGSASSSTS